MRGALLGLVAGALLLAGCARSDPPKAVAGDDGMVLSAKEIERSTRDARLGDASAAVKLAIHYETKEPADITVSRRWWLVAARRGDCSATEALYERFTLTGDVPDLSTAQTLERLRAKCARSRH